MRRMTLLKVSTFIVRHQLDFFLDGSPLRPLTLKDIAAACHVSISTACRAVKNKYICTENGVYHLGYFLIREFSFSADSPAVSVAYIKQILADIIAKEDKSRPYSDYRLYDIFQSIHIPIARRTITKYRKALKIPDSRYRKKRT
jgi:RNA polymerase sigma-54 factor